MPANTRSIVLLARSGAGKTVACWKSFYDWFFHDAETQQPLLAGYLPCVVKLPLHDLECIDGKVVEQLILQSAKLNVKLIDLLRRWLTTGPPLLILFDLNAATDSQVQKQAAQEIVAFQEKYAGYGHRCLIIYRSTREDAPPMRELANDQSQFGFYDLQPLSNEQADGYLASLRIFERQVYCERGVNLPTLVRDESKMIEERELLQRLVARHVRSVQGINESIISTPLLMHFVASLKPSPIRKMRTVTGDVHTMDQHTNGVTCVTVLPDGCIVSGSRDSSVKVWDPASDRTTFPVDLARHRAIYRPGDSSQQIPQAILNKWLVVFP